MRLLLCALAVSSAAHAQDPHGTGQEEAIEKAASHPVECAKRESFEPLFKLSGSGQITGAHTQEDLAGANEEAFLKCPREFLIALRAQPKATRTDLIRRHFGVRHAPWELGAELKKWQRDPEVGAFVRANFQRFLAAKAPPE